MTALDLNAADRILSPPGSAFSTVMFGDLELEASPAPQGVGVSAFGFPSIPRGALDSTLVSEEWAPNGHHALFMAFENLAGATDCLVISGALLLYVVGTTVSVVSVDGGYFGSGATITSFGSGLTVFAIVGSSSEMFLASNVDGVIATGSPGSGAGASPLVLPPDSSGSSPHLLGAWMFEDVDVSQADALDTIDEILTLFPAPFMLDGGGTGDIAGVGTLTTGENPFDPPVIAPPTSGGAQTPPDVPAFIVPSNVPDVLIRQVAEIMPAPTVVGGWPQNWAPTSVIDRDYGRLQIVVEGEDITWIDGIPTPFPRWSDVEPFGFQSASIELPQITIHQALPAWAMKNANVEIRLVRTAAVGGGFTRVFVGVVFDMAVDEDTGVFSLECIGVMFVDDYQLRKPAFTTAPQDIGALIPDLLNSVVGRRHETMSRVATGVTTSIAGGWEPLLTGYVQRLLATALSGGKQWTVRCINRTPELVQKDTSTIHWDVWAGQRGVKVTLDTDTSDQTNVIYGEGVNEDGGWWRNARYPNWRPDDTPAYPFDNPATTFRVGLHDAGTDSGTGVSDAQRKMGVTVTGVWSQSDVAELRRRQRASGIQVDGILGPQSWAMLFDTGANTGTLDGAFIMPLAFASEVMPRLYGPDGDDLGANPEYDPDIVRNERKIDFGQGVTLREAVRAAEEIIARDSVDGWHGSVEFQIDPATMSRYELRAGQNGRIRGVRGDQTVIVHTSAVDVSEDSVVCQVDTKARDYPTLDAIRDRERNATDPAQQAVKRLLQGQIGSDRPVYDAESPAGRMPRHAVFSNLWDVRRMPMGAYGDIVRSEVTASSPASRFAVAVFGKPVSAAQLLAVVGNPLTTSDTEPPWSKYGDALDDMGLLQAWGWKEQPMGYYPRAYSNPLGETSAPITGRMVDDAYWSYASSQAPWLWVAFIANQACYMEARFYGAAS